MTEIALPCGRLCLIDEADLHLLEGRYWRSQKQWNTFYVIGSRPGESRKARVRLHTLITGFALVDHRDGDGLNNQRANLRPATPSQNMWNKRPKAGKRFKGTVFEARLDKYRAAITCNGKKRYSPYFADEAEAAGWYDAKALELFGEFAWLNFRDEREAEPVEHSKPIQLERPGKRFRGVTLDRRRGTYQVMLQSGGKRYRRSGFADEAEAARAYDKMALEHFGPGCWRNFPGDRTDQGGME